MRHAAGRRRRRERGCAPPRARRRSRRLRVRVRDPWHDRRRRLDERRRVRRRLLRVLERALVATADGTGWLTPAELGLSYRHSNLRHGQVVLRAELRLRPRPPDEIKAEVRELNARRKEAQPTNRRTFGSVFKNPDHELSAGRMLEACGLKGHRIGGAQISPKHAELHRERRRRPDGGRGRAHGRGAAPCPRAVRRRVAARGRVPRRARAAAASAPDT